MAHKLNINFKKLVVAVFAFAFALPLIASGNAFADEPKCFEYDGTAYETFGEARNAMGADGGTINMTCDVTTDSYFGVSKNITLNLNNHSYTTSGFAAFQVTNSTFTINGKGSITGASSAVVTIDGGKTILNGANLTAGDWATTVFDTGEFVMNSGNVECTNPECIGVSGNGSTTGGKITLNSGTITSTDLGVYAPQINGVTTIGNGVTINATKAGVEIRAGSLTINGATINVPATASYVFNPNGNGSTASGVAVAVAQHTTTQSINVAINSGTFTAPVAFAEANPQMNSADAISKVSLAIKGGTFNATNGEPVVASEDVEKFITGGTFNKDVNEDYIANGYDSYGLNGRFVIREEDLAVYGEPGSQVLEPKITSENFKVSSEHFYKYREDSTNSIDVRIGNPIENAFSVVLPTGSTSGITISLDNEYYGDGAEAEIDGNYTITGVTPGYLRATISPSYDNTISFSFWINVYSVAPSDENEEAEVIAADTIKDLIDNEWPEEPADVSDKLKEAFGEEEIESVISDFDYSKYWGEVITTNLERNEEVELTDEEKAKIEAVLEAEGIGSDNIVYTDISILVNVERDEDLYTIGSLHKLNGKAKFFLADTTDPDEGYERTYYVVKYHNGVATLLKEGEDFVIENGEIYVFSDEFSIFAFAFLDNLIPVEEPEDEPEEDNSYTIRPAENEKTEEVVAPTTGTAKRESVSATSTFSIAIIAIFASFVGLIGLTKKYLARK
ncbi:hypothetical protein IKG45_01630 [Candidatus Saccharibacteria bacterium]|nr:hypothetical protein [Candidatus Saccharibacteria bacterium]